MRAQAVEACTHRSRRIELLYGLSCFAGCLVAVDKLYLFYCTIFYKGMALLNRERWEPTRRYPVKWKRGIPLPRVIVQLPMFNETHVAARIIERACRINWPRERLEVQVLDDSTDAETRAMVDAAIEKMRQEGTNIDVVRRTNRQGFKAGAMHDAHTSIKAEFIAIFDADFLPDADFLLRTIPFFHDHRVGFVQGRWTYVNAHESLFCRYQEICLNAHIKCEQYARFSTGNFFNFNGTGGVWRKACIDDAGGWNARTLVEDLDLSLRAFLKGWEFVWVHDCECPNEIPADYKAYRKQQRRWSCGPMQLWVATRQTVKQSCLPPLQKAYLNIFFFGVRMLATNVVSFTFYSVLVPIMLLVHVAELQGGTMHYRFMPWWSMIWLPLITTITTMSFTPYSFHYMVIYVMYENAMSILKLGAALEGLMNFEDAMTWTVTQKLGAVKARGFDLLKIIKNLSFFAKEGVVGVALIAVGLYGYRIGASRVFAIYFTVQGFIFVIFSLSLVETFNLLPPPKWQLLGLPYPNAARWAPPPALKEKRSSSFGKSRHAPYDDDAISMISATEEMKTLEEGYGTEGDVVQAKGQGYRRPLRVQPPSLRRVMYANVVVFLYSLPINALSIVLLYGVTTIALSPSNDTQWDDAIALALALVIVPVHMCWCFGSPQRNLRDRRLARKGQLPISTGILHTVQLLILYLLLLLLFIISMYSASDTLQDYVSRELYIYFHRQVI